MFYKYMLKYLKMIANPRQNTLKLSCWDITKKDAIFKKLSEEIGKKVLEYHSSFIEATKVVSSEDVKYINRLFPELSTEVMLNNGFYSNF